MNRLTAVLLTGLMALSFTTAGFAAEVAKIGTFDINRVLTESSAGKMAQKEMRQKFTEIQDKLKNEKEQLEKMKKDLEREAMVLSAEKSQEKQRDFRIRVNDFKKMQEDKAREFKTMENDLKNKMIKEILDVAGDIGKKEGYLLILEEKNSGIFYRPDRIDITNKMIENYNIKLSKTKK